jgi:alpha-glucosidase
VFTFDSRRFPDPRQLAADVAADGMRLVTIVDPGVKVDRHYAVFREGSERGAFTTRTNGRMFSMHVWPGASAFPDFYRSEVRQWWGDLHRVYVDAGIAGIWNDMNEPSGWKRVFSIEDGIVPVGEANLGEVTHRLDDGRTVPDAMVHNAYGHLENRATYEGLVRLRPAERPFVLTRSAFAGTQRWAWQWTGDVLSTWGALRQSLTMIMGAGLSGMPFAGADIGGFIGDSWGELYARWMQIGALAPFCRSHTSIHTHRQEPWSFGPEAEAIARDALKLRYRLLPYLYSCAWEASQSGMPIWRPLFAEFPDDERCWEVEDQVMVGPSLLAAPVMEPDTARRRVVLPPGTWFDWHSGQATQGGETIEVEAPRDRLPLFVRGDRAIPTQDDVRHTGDNPGGPVRWCVFLAGTARGTIGTLYEDDGLSFAYRDGDWRRTCVAIEERDGGVALVVGPGEGAYVSPRQVATIELHAPGFTPARLDGQPIAPGAPLQLAHDGRHYVELIAVTRQG